MTDGAWSLERFLLQITSSASIDAAAEILLDGGGAGHPVNLLSSAWFRAGAETYCMRCTIERAEYRVDLVAKACVPSVGPVGAVFDDWLFRRQCVVDCGISTPRLYGWHEATILEEWIPNTFIDVWRHAHENRRELSAALSAAVRSILRVGFHPISLHDIRSRGDDVVLIDFGSDLGPPSDGGDINESAMATFIVRYFESNGEHLSTHERRSILDAP